MKKRKISLIIIALAMALCMALCIILPACSSDDKKDNSSDHTHTYNVLKYDDENHWYECSCGEVSPDDPVPHASENGYKYDDDNHWQVCDVCEQKFMTEAHELTNDKCDVCGYEPEVHTHKYTKQNYNETSHWYECECGEIDESSIEAHDSNAYSSDTEYHWAVCSVCGYYDKSDDSIKVQHSVTDTAYKSDRTYHWHECDVCGEVFDKAEHSLGDDDTCTICGYEKGELTSTTIYMVGDSTMCAFTDTIYIPRYGYGTQLANYLTDETDEDGEPLITVKNLAWSGRSSVTYITDSQSNVWYEQMVNGISEGDYLIIGFGHNDEKSGETFTNPTIPYGTDTDGLADGFQDNLYNNYIAVARSKGATPILCTPIVRYNEKDDYTGSSAHITDDGNYPQAIRDLGTATGTTVIDLTATTAADYGEIKGDAVWYHSYSSAELVDDDSTDAMARVIKDSDGKDVTVIPSGIDTTHINMYGAKMVSYELVTELAKTSNSLKDYIAEDITKPTMENDFTDEVYYSDYVYRQYSSFDPETDVSTYWGTFPDGWYGTAFGDTGGDNNYTYFTVKYENETYTVGAEGQRGKITSGGDGFAAAFMQIKSNANFTATADVEVKTLGTTTDSSGESAIIADNQSGFGMMLRDDIYVNKYVKSLTSTFVTAGVFGGGTKPLYANSYRKDDSLKNGTSMSGTYEVGSKYSLKVQRVEQTIYCTLTLSDGTTFETTAIDYKFDAVDSDFVYLCLFATRGVICDFTNVTYSYDGDMSDQV